MLDRLFHRRRGGGLSNTRFIYNWILAGIAPGGVAAHAVVTVAFWAASALSTLVPFSFRRGATLRRRASAGREPKRQCDELLWVSLGTTDAVEGNATSFQNPTSASVTFPHSVPHAENCSKVGS